jgi:hypothetical protein
MRSITGYHEDSVGALVELKRDGKIRHIGVSNVSERELARARAIATIVSVQNCYNLRDRSSDRLIDICAGAGIAFIPWYPLAAGRLASPNSRFVRSCRTQLFARSVAVEIGHGLSRVLYEDGDVSWEAKFGLSPWFIAPQFCTKPPQRFGPNSCDGHALAGPTELREPQGSEPPSPRGNCLWLLLGVQWQRHQGRPGNSRDQPVRGGLGVAEFARPGQCMPRRENSGRNR